MMTVESANDDKAFEAVSWLTVFGFDKNSSNEIFTVRQDKRSDSASRKGANSKQDS